MESNAQLKVHGLFVQSQGVGSEQGNLDVFRESTTQSPLHSVSRVLKKGKDPVPGRLERGQISKGNHISMDRSSGCTESLTLCHL